MRQRIIIVFARAPRMGSVKTRLAKGIGRADALRFYRSCLERTIRTCGRVNGAEVVICAAPDNAVHGRYFRGGSLLLPQNQGDIGERMARALDRFPTADRILIGGDIPSITVETLDLAFDGLRTNRVVFGPAEDGGFWLVGLRGGFQPRRLFRSVGWSTPETLRQAIQTLPPHEGIAFTRCLNDIDDLDDYRRLTSP